MDTIAAISTPNAVGGLAVIRISGEDSISIAEKIFRPQNENKIISQMKGYTACYGKVHNKDEDIDDGVLLVFRAPNSYTGENVAEISVHGGTYIAKLVLRSALEHGARMADAGEFSKRAFVNGKLSLTQAESVIDLIEANGKATHRSALMMRDGKLNELVNSATDTIVSICAEISAWIDYPEEDIPSLQDDNLIKSLTSAKQSLDSLLRDYDTGRLLKEGISTVIVGKPNAGKSTLMNLLSRCERSIVTDIAGTTRDIIEESVRLDDDIILRLADTAGIRETDDTVESMGVTLSRKKIETSDLVLAVFDSSVPLSKEDEDLLSSLSPDNTIAVFNKQDMDEVLDKEKIKSVLNYSVEISAKTGFNSDELIALIKQVITKNGNDLSAPLIINERQRSCVYRANELIAEAIDSVNLGITLDAVGATLDAAANELLVLSGKKATESVVNEVFKRFCVGK